MKTSIKEITSVTSEGVSFKLTKKASLNGGFSADQWYVSWDKIGGALFGEQYSNEGRQVERESNKASQQGIDNGADNRQGK